MPGASARPARRRCRSRPAMPATSDAAMVHAPCIRWLCRGRYAVHRECWQSRVPGRFDLGQHRNVVLLSVTEGDDKPEKYPVMFRAADLMAITKMDLLQPVGDFDPAQATRHPRNLANPAEVIALSARTARAWSGGSTGWSPRPPRPGARPACPPVIPMRTQRPGRMADAADWLARIHALQLPAVVRVLNVCGGHERSIGLAGLRVGAAAGGPVDPGPRLPGLHLPGGRHPRLHPACRSGPA